MNWFFVDCPGCGIMLPTDVDVVVYCRCSKVFLVKEGEDDGEED